MSMAHMMGERGASGRSRSRRAAFSQTAGQEVWRPGSDDRDPVAVLDHGQADRKREWQSGSRPSPDDGRPSTPSKRFRRERRFCRESLSLSSRGSYILDWRWSGDRLQGQNQQGSGSDCCLSRSDSLEEWMCPPLPGQVPVEPTETSNGLMEDSPVNKSSTEKPTECKKRKGIRSFLGNAWKAMKRSLLCCCLSGAVDVVEPFVPPADLEPEPDPDPSSPVPDHSGVKPYNDSFETLYDVGEMIGSGGFGRVYKGTRTFDGKKVAVKRMRKDDNEDLYLAIPGHPEPLITEVALLLMMRQEPISPYVIQLYDWFEHPRKFTLIMEFPEPCESLLDFITGHPQLDETTARVIMRQAVLAVQHCIERGVFHNDIHAENFLLKKDTLELKLIDFGSGQLLSSDGYESEVYVGLLDYIPPEVFTEPHYHAIPTNVWSLGVLLYEMMNCARPFYTTTEITQAKVTFQNSNLSKECRDLISQCLTRDPTKRPTLEQMLQHEWIKNDQL